MSIEAAVKTATTSEAARSTQFKAQLESNRAFHDRMQKAGVVPKKQEFTIPLMERIVTPA